MSKFFLSFCKSLLAAKLHNTSALTISFILPNVSVKLHSKYLCKHYTLQILLATRLPNISVFPFYFLRDN